MLISGVLLIFLLASVSKIEGFFKEKIQIPPWMTPLKLGFIGGLIYGSKQLRAVTYSGDFDGYLNQPYSGGYATNPYSTPSPSINVLPIPPLLFPYRIHVNCPHRNRCGNLPEGGENGRYSGWDVPLPMRQTAAPLRPPVTRPSEFQGGTNFFRPSTNYNPDNYAPGPVLHRRPTQRSNTENTSSNSGNPNHYRNSNIHTSQPSRPNNPEVTLDTPTLTYTSDPNSGKSGYLRSTVSPDASTNIQNRETHI